MVGTIASPSSPSVRFTALEAPIITNIATSGNSRPNEIIRFLNTGTASSVPSGCGISRVIHTAATRPIAACAHNFTRPGTPLVLRLVSLRKSSAKPIAP